MSYFEAEQFEFNFHKNLKKDVEKVYIDIEDTNNNMAILTNEEKDIIKTLAIFDGMDSKMPISYIFYLKYLTSLDLLHNLEKKLTEHQWIEYVEGLLGFKPGNGIITYKILSQLIHKSAQEKALNLWKVLR